MKNYLAKLPMQQKLIFCGGVQDLLAGITDIKVLEMIYDGIIPTVKITKLNMELFRKSNAASVSTPCIYLNGDGEYECFEPTNLAGYAWTLKSSLVLAMVEQKDDFNMSDEIIQELSKLNYAEISDSLVSQAVRNTRPYRTDGESKKVYFNKITAPIEKHAAVKWLWKQSQCEQRSSR